MHAAVAATAHNPRPTTQPRGSNRRGCLCHTTPNHHTQIHRSQPPWKPTCCCVHAHQAVRPTKPIIHYTCPHFLPPLGMESVPLFRSTIYPAPSALPTYPAHPAATVSARWTYEAACCWQRSPAATATSGTSPRGFGTPLAYLRAVSVCHWIVRRCCIPYKAALSLPALFEMPRPPLHFAFHVRVFVPWVQWPTPSLVTQRCTAATTTTTVGACQVHSVHVLSPACEGAAAAVLIECPMYERRLVALTVDGEPVGNHAFPDGASFETATAMLAIPQAPTQSTDPESSFTTYGCSEWSACPQCFPSAIVVSFPFLLSIFFSSSFSLLSWSYSSRYLLSICSHPVLSLLHCCNVSTTTHRGHVVLRSIVTGRVVCTVVPKVPSTVFEGPRSLRVHPRTATAMLGEGQYLAVLRYAQDLSSSTRFVVALLCLRVPHIACAGIPDTHTPTCVPSRSVAVDETCGDALLYWLNVWGLQAPTTPPKSTQPSDGTSAEVVPVCLMAVEFSGYCGNVPRIVISHAQDATYAWLWKWRFWFVDTMHMEGLKLLGTSAGSTDSGTLPGDGAPAYPGSCRGAPESILAVSSCRTTVVRDAQAAAAEDPAEAVWMPSPLRCECEISRHLKTVCVTTIATNFCIGWMMMCRGMLMSTYMTSRTPTGFAGGRTCWNALHARYGSWVDVCAHQATYPPIGWEWWGTRAAGRAGSACRRLAGARQCSDSAAG